MKDPDRLKSCRHETDPVAMDLILQPGHLWIFVLLISGWAVIMALEAVAGKLEYERAKHDLKVNALNLRQRQLQRLARVRGQRPMMVDPADDAEIIEVGEAASESDATSQPRMAA